MSQEYNLSEIAKNNGKNGMPVWIIIKGAVYDVTDFISEHPGGDDAILEYAGKDATQAFNSVGHSTDAIKDLKLYKIGEVAKNSATPTSPVLITNQQQMTPAVLAKQKESEQYCAAEKKKFKFFFCF